MSAVARIALVGPMGIGKTTAIRTLCGRTTVDCDVPNLDLNAHAKPTTTVCVDFGELALDNGERLQIYGCPGQARFDFVREWVLTLSAGVFVMTDLHAPRAVQDAMRLLSDVSRLRAGPLPAVLVARPASRAMLEDFSSVLKRGGLKLVPVLQIDVRDPRQMHDALLLMAAMLALEEARG